MVAIRAFNESVLLTLTREHNTYYPKFHARFKLRSLVILYKPYSEEMLLSVVKNSRMFLFSTRRLVRFVHFRGPTPPTPTPPLKDVSHKVTEAGIIVEDFVVHSPARSHVRDFKSEATKRDQVSNFFSLLSHSLHNNK